MKVKALGIELYTPTMPGLLMPSLRDFHISGHIIFYNNYIPSGLFNIQQDTNYL